MQKTIIRGYTYFYNDLNPEKTEAILLVHGHPFDHTMWRYQHNALKEYRLILPDLKGYGKTEYKFDKIHIEEQALDLALLLDNLNINKVHLIGLSMGGQIIVEFARLFRNRVKSLILCDTNPAGENEISHKNRLNLAKEISSIGMKEYTEQNIHKYLHPLTISLNKEVYTHLYDMMVNTNKEGAVASHKGRAERRDNYDFLKQLKVPTLVIVGDSDFFTPVSEMEDIAKQIPGARFSIIKDAGHMPNMEQSEMFNEQLSDFYKSIIT